MRFWSDIFRTESIQADKEDSRGEVIFFKIFELFVAVFVIRFAWEWGIYIQQISEVVLPLGIAEYIDISFMFDNGISLVNAGLMTLFVGMGFFRIFPRLAYPAAILLFHLHYAARYCLGEISHGSNFMGMSLLALALAFLFFREPANYRHFALGFLIFFVGLGYTSAGMSKLIGTGLDWPSGEHLWLWIAERRVDVLSATGAFTPNLLQEYILRYHWLSTVTLSFGLLTELLGFLFWFPRTRPWIAVALMGMHLGVYLSMNIMFDLYIYELLILGFPWAAWMDRYLDFRDSRLARAGYELSARLA